MSKVWDELKDNLDSSTMKHSLSSLVPSKQAWILKHSNEVIEFLYHVLRDNKVMIHSNMENNYFFESVMKFERYLFIFRVKVS